MRRNQLVQEINYLDVIFNDNDYESPEEKAIRGVEQLPDRSLDTSLFSRRKGIRCEEI